MCRQMQSELFILNQPRNYLPDGEGLSKATTHSPWTRTPRAGSPDKPPTPQGSEAVPTAEQLSGHMWADAALGEKSHGTDFRDRFEKPRVATPPSPAPRTNE